MIKVNLYTEMDDKIANYKIVNKNIKDFIKSCLIQNKVDLNIIVDIHVDVEVGIVSVIIHKPYILNIDELNKVLKIKSYSGTDVFYFNDDNKNGMSCTSYTLKF